MVTTEAGKNLAGMQGDTHIMGKSEIPAETETWQLLTYIARGRNQSHSPAPVRINGDSVHKAVISHHHGHGFNSPFEPVHHSGDAQVFSEYSQFLLQLNGMELVDCPM